MAYDEVGFNRQSEEFEAVAEASKAFNALPAIVDDDYPEARHRYEGAINRLCKALRANRPEAFK